MSDRAYVAPEIPDERYCRLMAFADTVLTVCIGLGIDPLLDGSMAVRVYTEDASIIPRDIDLNCPEHDFPRFKAALDATGIFCEIQPWHVLQARRDGLKVEFGAIEHWADGLSGPDEWIRIGTHTVRMVNRASLREQYQRGLDATAADPEEREKHERMAVRLHALDAMIDRR